MPELPEVEVTRRAIRRILRNRVVSEVLTGSPSSFFLTPPDRLRRALVGRCVTEIRRHGKYLLLSLDNQTRLLLHLGMTGQLLASPATSRRQPLPKHTHLGLRFRDGGRELRFRDVRKFGKVRLLARGSSDPRLDKLGPDALSVAGTLLWAAARRRRCPIKSLLLDQSVLAGVGNIYADEALYLARIRPTRRARSLDAAECEALARAVRRVLRAAIARGGSTIDDFVRPDGSRGGYQAHHRVYGRAGKPCPKCRTPIARRVIGQRSTCYCPSCQK